MVCLNQGLGTCPGQTTVPRELAEELIIDAVIQFVSESIDLPGDVYAAAIRIYEAAMKSTPEQLQKLRSEKSRMEIVIENLINQCEATFDIGISERIARRRKELDEINERILTIESPLVALGPPPTIEYVRNQLVSMAKGLAEKGTEAAYVLRNLIPGKILIHEVRVDNRKRHYVKAVFDVVLANDSEQTSANAKSDRSLPNFRRHFEIDLRVPYPYEATAGEAYRLFCHGLSLVEIEKQLKYSRTLVTRALAHAFAEVGRPLSDRSNNRHRTGGRTAPKIMSRVVELYVGGSPLKEIAEKVGFSMMVIREALRLWVAKTGVVLIDGRTRRKELRQHAQAKKAIEGSSQENEEAA